MRRLVGLALGMALCAGGAGSGAADTGARDFTFKRVKVGEPASGARRITVQIDPEEQARVLAANPAIPPAPAAPSTRGPEAAPGPDTPAKSAYGWYWSHLSPALSAASAARLEPAVAALGKGPGGASVRAPRLATLQRIADAHGRHILMSTAGSGVSPALVLAVISVESAGRADAVSSAGAAGLMQLMPATAERFGVTDRTDPAQNIRGGVAYLDWLLDRFGNDPLLALAGYNAGEGAVDDHGGVPPFAETRDYVPKVMAAWRVATGMCLTPPQLISDGCVFRTAMAAQ